jgi:transposase-like protein
MYSKAFRTLMVQKMTSLDRPNVESLSADVGVPQSTLYRWVSVAGKLIPRGDSVASFVTDPTQRPIRMKRPQDWSAEEKLAAVLKAAALPDEELGGFLRSKGIHVAQLQEWRELMLSGLNPASVQRSKKKTETKRVRELEKELRRKDKALAETAALLVLKKKVQAIWGDEDDDMES